MSDSISLESVAYQFSAWRKSKKTKAGRIPDRILDDVASLSTRHSSAEIIRVLKLSSVSWNSRRLQSRIRAITAGNTKVITNWVEVKQPTIGTSKVRLRRQGVEMEFEIFGEGMLAVVREFVQGGAL
jgi:hypothetical protein